MNKELLIIDQHYEYEIDQILEGGMGRVLLLSRTVTPGKLSLNDIIYDRPEIQDRFKLPYRNKLAAKTVKASLLMRDFQRECIIWLEINEPGIVPLLKVVNINGLVFALMPRYSKSLRDVLQLPNLDRLKIIKSLYNPVLGLANVHSSKGLVHQDIKPENFLCSEDKNNLSMFLSDWGIANVQANMLSNASLTSPNFTFQTMAGFGTVPYMAPERFFSYYSTMSADIFSLGIIFFEIATGNWPYNTTKPIEDQIISGEYFSNASNQLAGYGNKKLSNTILKMIHPATEKRIQNYKEILKIIKSF